VHFVDVNCIHFRGKVLEMKLRSGKNYLRLHNPASISSHCTSHHTKHTN